MGAARMGVRVFEERQSSIFTVCFVIVDGRSIYNSSLGVCSLLPSENDKQNAASALLELEYVDVIFLQGSCACSLCGYVSSTTNHREERMGLCNAESWSMPYATPVRKEKSC